MKCANWAGSLVGNDLVGWICTHLHVLVHLLVSGDGDGSSWHQSFAFSTYQVRESWCHVYVSIENSMMKKNDWYTYNTFEDRDHNANAVRKNQYPFQTGLTAATKIDQGETRTSRKSAATSKRFSDWSYETACNCMRVVRSLENLRSSVEMCQGHSESWKISLRKE